MPNSILERIHQVLRNLVRTFNVQQTYVDEKYPWTGILDAAAFSIFSRISGRKGYSPVQLISGRDMILPIKYRLDWGLIRQQKLTQIYKDNVQKYMHRVDHDYKVGEKVMFAKYNTYKYETPYNGPFVITQCFTNGTVNLQYGTT